MTFILVWVNRKTLSTFFFISKFGINTKYLFENSLYVVLEMVSLTVLITNQLLAEQKEEAIAIHMLACMHTLNI